MRSEPETAAMLQVAQHFKPHVWVNAHSGMEALFMPCAPRPCARDGGGVSGGQPCDMRSFGTLFMTHAHAPPLTLPDCGNGATFQG